MWTDGSKVRYTRWARGQPDNSLGKEHCTETNLGDMNILSKLPNVFFLRTRKKYDNFVHVSSLFVCGTLSLFSFYRGLLER